MGAWAVLAGAQGPTELLALPRQVGGHTPHPPAMPFRIAPNTEPSATMATPRRIVRIYAALAAHSSEVAGFLAASGGSSATVKLLEARDAATLLRRWGEEMQELCGVLDGTHHDSYLMEATQTFYWASCFAAVRQVAWEDLAFDDLARQAVNSGIGSAIELRANCARLASLAPDVAKPSKLFLLWRVAERLYRSMTKPENQWSLEQMLEADLQEMKKRPYLAPILSMVPE